MGRSLSRSSSSRIRLLSAASEKKISWRSTARIQRCTTWTATSTFKTAGKVGFASAGAETELREYHDHQFRLADHRLRCGVLVCLDPRLHRRPAGHRRGRLPARPGQGASPGRMASAAHPHRPWQRIQGRLRRDVPGALHPSHPDEASARVHRPNGIRNSARRTSPG